MKFSTSLSLCAALIPLANSTPTHPSAPPGTTTSCATSATTATSSPSSLKQCTEYTISLNITSTNKVFSPPFFANNYDLTDFVQNATSSTANVTFVPFSSNVTESAAYTLSGTFCTPAQLGGAGKEKTVLLATHGLNFDRNYWDPALDSEKYSFTDAAIREGYSIFAYDRLGVGKSQKISGYKNQLSIQVALATALAKAIKAGQYTAAVGVPSKLVLVGHSYGSAISASVAVAEPALAEGLILTGFSYAGATLNNWILASQFRIASTQRRRQWSILDTGYITTVDIFASIIGFFKKPDYDVTVAKYAEKNKQPIAIAEVLTASGPPPTPYNYTGAAMVIAGQYDFIFCGSQCDNVIEHPAREIFAQAKAFQAVSYPGAGHGLNLALNAAGSFKIILDFINANV